MFTIAQYSRTATLDLRSAMALSLARFLRDKVFFNPGQFQFAQVFEDWPSYLKRFVSPSACVLPGSWIYADALMTPHLLEKTVEPMNEAGEMLAEGFGLYKLSEMEVTLEVSLRASSVAERSSIILGLEDKFRAPRLLMDDAAGPRYGIIVEMPEYYGMCARFALQSARVVDDEDRAMREQRDAVFVISGQAPQVTVGPVAPLSVVIRKKQMLPDGTCVDL